jgi:putrescine aminotransferase
MAGPAATEIRRSHGVIVRDYGNTIVLAPPLVMSELQAFRAAEAVTAVLSRLRPNGGLDPR